MMDTMVILYQT
uniref:Uncharacterized protein n=1 Tax=Arundo donax TaxID=35708 RepID=A0A0A9C7T3_ARUDO